MDQPIELIAGLGNPEPRYLLTRHNAGFWYVDSLAQSHGTQFKADRKLQAEVSEVRVAEHRIRLIKPTTYMNLSGQSLAATLSYYKIPADRVLVVYDEIDLPPGTVRLKFAGGHAGHNGIRSIIDHIGPEFWRLRLGVGHPGSKDRVIGHVLKPAATEDRDAIFDAIRRSIDILPVLIERGPQAAQNELHTRARSPQDEEEPPGEGI